MAKQSEKSDQKYRSLRNEFDDLQLEEKAVFLIESGLSLFIHSIESLTSFVRDEINKMADGNTTAEPVENKEDATKKEAPKRKSKRTASKKSTSRPATSEARRLQRAKIRLEVESEDSTT